MRRLHDDDDDDDDDAMRWLSCDAAGCKRDVSTTTKRVVALDAQR